VIAVLLVSATLMYFLHKSVPERTVPPTAANQVVETA